MLKHKIARPDVGKAERPKTTREKRRNHSPEVAPELIACAMQKPGKPE
jgi:hypothetical protein